MHAIITASTLPSWQVFIQEICGVDLALEAGPLTIIF